MERMPDDRKPDAPAASSLGAKKPYVTPSVQTEPVFETLALACGKMPGQGGTCIGAPHRS